MIVQVVPLLFGLGSNLGDREATINEAVQRLAATPDLHVVQRSPFRETIALRPDGPDPDAPRYLNAVVSAETTLGHREVFHRMQEIEKELGRTRGELWGDRTIDIDLILYGGAVIREPDLVVPHPRAHERDFVLSPWLELDPQAVLIGRGSVAALLESIGDTTTPYVSEPS